MPGVILIVLIVLGFYAFIGTASKQASEMLLAGMWAILGIITLGSIVASLLR